MKKKILNHTSIMIVLAVLITFLAASVVTYSKFNTYMQNGVREEARYICLSMEECGDTFLSKRLRAVSSSRVTLIQKDIPGKTGKSQQPSGVYGSGKRRKK